MEINDKSVDSMNDSVHFEFERFDFLLKSVPAKAQKGFHSVPLTITCFDLNLRYFVFGSNIGVIYCFRRGQISGPHLKYQLISSSINIIKLISDELMAFVSDSGVYLINWLNRKFLYGWKCPTNASITCIQAYMSVNDKKLLLISGDSQGVVRYHDLISCEQIIIFQEVGFQIIQIEFIDSYTLLISSSLKTVVIICDFNNVGNNTTITQIGKNERKTYGKYGAVYSFKSNIIYGSRPSLHLIKAELNGNVIETIRLNNIVQTPCQQELEEFSKLVSGKISYKLGILKLFCAEDYIISWNDSNLLLIRSDGQFCMKEKVDKLIDVKISHRDSNEAFLLLESKYIIRVRNKSFVSSSEFEESSDTESRHSDDYEIQDRSTESRSSSESLLNLFKGPLNMNPISRIDEELKKAFDKLQSRVTQKFDKLSHSIISTIDSSILSNSNQNVFVTPIHDNGINDNSDDNDSNDNSQTKDSPEELSPLVVTTKVKRRLIDKKTNVVNSENDSINNNEVVTSSSESTTNDVSANDISANVATISQTANQIKVEDSENTDSNNDDRLLMILSAYKEANKLDSIYVDQQPIETNFFYSSEMSIPTNDANKTQVKQIDDVDSHQIESVDNEANEQREESTKVIKSLEINWEKVINFSDVDNPTIDELSSFCASGYDSRTEVGLIWFVCKKNMNNCLLYYPSFNELKLPKGFPLQITSSTYDLYVLTNNGFIYKKEGMDATKPLGTKWTNIKINKSKCRLTSISLNLNNSILWCCDENGETWTNQLKNQKWTLINDFSSHSIEMRKVCVSLNDWTVVWGIDKSGKVFTRIFDFTGDKHNEVSGDNWILIDGILAIDLVVCCDDSVWIAVSGNRLYRRNGKIAQNSNIEDEWEEVIGPLLIDDSYASISASGNNDIWLLTAKGCVWHTFDPLKKNSTNDNLNNDWLLIN